jgi:hypothetical protein
MKVAAWEIREFDLLFFQIHILFFIIIMKDCEEVVREMVVFSQVFIEGYLFHLFSVSLITDRAIVLFIQFTKAVLGHFKICPPHKGEIFNFMLCYFFFYNIRL